MSTQISIQLSERLYSTAKEYADRYGFDSLQDLIREVLRQKLFEDEKPTGGLETYLASEASLAKNWLTEEEDRAWEHLQKGT